MTSCAITLIVIAGTAQVDRPPPLSFNGPPVDYVAWCNEFVRRGKSDNSFPAYERFYSDGRNGVPVVDDPATKQQWESLEHLIWRSEDCRLCLQHLEACKPYIRLLRTAAQKRDFWQVIPDGSRLYPHLDLRPLIQSRHVTEAVIATVSMRQPDHARVIRDGISLVLRSAGHMQQQGMLAGCLVGRYERDYVYDLVLVAVEQGCIDKGDLAATHFVLSHFDPGFPDFDAVLTGEWATMLDALQYVCPDGKVSEARWKELKKDFVGGSRAFDPRATAREIDAYYQSLQRITRGRLSVQKLDQVIAYTRQWTSRKSKNPFIGDFGRYYSRSYELLIRSETKRRATLLALALSAHRDKHGSWPRDLTGIDADLGLPDLAESRLDPFSGANFRYKIKGGKPILYSVGPDGKDDGGKHDDEWGEEKDGDYVFQAFKRTASQAP